jgi:hypothetical protein
MLTVANGHRHNGTAGTGVVLDGVDTDQGIRVSASYAVVDGFEFRRHRNAAGAVAVVVQNNAYDVLLQNLLIHDFLDAVNSVSGVRGQDDSDYTVRNTIVYDGDVAAIRNNASTAHGIVESVTVHGMDEWGVLATAGTMFVRNTASMDNPSGDFAVASGTMVQAANMSSDATATGSQAEPSRVAADQFVSIAPGSEDFHLKAGANAIDQGWHAYTPEYSTDIDGTLRPFTQVPDPLVPGPWDIGADEFGATTAVDLVSFTASALDAAVELRWMTGSEMDTLGFHVYRGPGAEGPWERATPSVIPGLGFSPEGARYAYTDTPLQNGRAYFYLLEEVETTGRTARHGPVTATPGPGASPGDGETGGTGGGATGPPGEGGVEPEDDRTPRPLVFGDPGQNSLSVRASEGGEIVLDLRTGGFRGTPRADGTVALDVPGFDGEREPGRPGLPSRLAWVEAVAGRNVAVASVRERDVLAFDLRPAHAGRSALVVGRDGSVTAAERPAAARPARAGLYPAAAAELLETAFQGETKKALVRLSPLRFDAGSGRLLLARRLEVRLVLGGRATDEVPLGGPRGRLDRRPRPRPAVLARLVTRAAGLHAVAFEEIARGSRRPLVTSSLRLSRRGETVAHRIEPAGSPFGPGSRLFFLAAGPEANPDGDECVYELERSSKGIAMASRDASPGGPELAESLGTARFERNARYMPALLGAPDPWLWEAVGAASAKAFPFALEEVKASPTPPGSSCTSWGGATSPSTPTTTCACRSTARRSPKRAGTASRLERSRPPSTPRS